ncbi:Centromere protein Cenp-I [Penicillium herquei]|nr:Centromere protein Cenp-I [Penicillium herquei]
MSSMDIDSESNERGSLVDAIEHLEAVAFVPVKKRYTDAAQLVKTIASDAYENGIPHDALGRLLKILTIRNNLDQGTITTLINNLYPQERVLSKHVTQVVCCLGPSKSKPTPATQSLLVRWLILTYEISEDRSHLGKLYAVLFNHLDMISLRKPLCHLLSLVTRRKHVKPFRIQALMELIQNSGGDEKDLVILLKMFKNYYPEIIIGDVGGSRRAALFFKHPDTEWASHVKALQAANLERTATSRGSSGFQIAHRGAAKRSKIEVVIPVLQTSRVSNKHTSLEELRDIDHFVDKIDMIELPNQIISALGDGMAQKYLHLVQSEVADHRLNEWLRNFLQDKLEQIQAEDGDDPDVLSYVLGFVEAYAAYTKQLLASVRSFLESYLESWNGQDDRAQVLGLLRFLPVEPWESLHARIFSPLESRVLDGSLGSRTDLLDFYSALIGEWGVKLRTQSSVPEESASLTALIRHAELLAFSIQEFIPMPDDSPPVFKPGSLSVLRLYKCLATLFSHASENPQIRISVPSAPLVYAIAFTPTISTVSTLGSVLAGYKAALEASLSSQTLKDIHAPESVYSANVVGEFNGYVMDMCNLVWRNRALNTDDPNARACLLSTSNISTLTKYVRDVNEAARHYDRESAFHCTLPNIFSLSHHAAYCNLSAACFAELEGGQQIAGEQRAKLRKPVTPKSLQALEKEGGFKITWQEYRIHMLEWLDEIGSRGTSELMRSTMKALKKD